MTLAHFRADSGQRSRLYPIAVLVGLVLLLSLGVSRLHGQTTQGSILGNVTDQAGAVVPGVEIEVKSQETNFARKTVTNTQGFFLIDRLDFGSYYVGAMKEEEGYGSSDSSFFNDNPPPMAQITAQHRSADVVVNLGPKAGTLTGTISDALTAKPIPAGFDLAQVKDRTKWMGTSAAPNFRVLIPSSKEIDVRVSAPGYEAWVYPDPTIPSQVLRMDPGSEMHLDIKLKPAHDRSLPLSKFLIPEGYVGWLRVEYDVECFPPMPVEDGVRIFRFTGSNVLETSSPMPAGAAERQYFYYAADGSERDLAADYRSGNGMIWQERPGSRGGEMSIFIFFVGTQEQSKTRLLPGFPPPACP